RGRWREVRPPPLSRGSPSLLHAYRFPLPCSLSNPLSLPNSVLFSDRRHFPSIHSLRPLQLQFWPQGERAERPEETCEGGDCKGVGKRPAPVLDPAAH